MTLEKCHGLAIRGIVLLKDETQLKCTKLTLNPQESEYKNLSELNSL